MSIYEIAGHDEIRQRGEALAAIQSGVKDAVLAQCEQPGASVARVAMEHGINANVVHSWRKRTRSGAVAHHAPVHEQFVPLARKRPAISS